jgi:uncharacterized metal-binding protein
MMVQNQNNNEMVDNVNPKCAVCKSNECRDGKDCFSQASKHRPLYNGDLAKLHRAASLVEAKYYCKETRLGEIILFAKELGYQKIGLAFCIGLSEEARIIENILSKHFEVVSVCCKVSGIGKKDFELERISLEMSEIMCNPAGQAQLLNEAASQLNVICGLCVGHDAIFSRLSEAPVTTLITKDRVLGHNPASAVYCQYIRRQIGKTQ